jgi:hypothetical protein
MKKKFSIVGFLVILLLIITSTEQIYSQQRVPEPAPHTVMDQGTSELEPPQVPDTKTGTSQNQQRPPILKAPKGTKTGMSLEPEPPHTPPLIPPNMQDSPEPEPPQVPVSNPPQL